MSVTTRRGVRTFRAAAGYGGDRDAQRERDDAEAQLLLLVLALRAPATDGLLDSGVDSGVDLRLDPREEGLRQRPLVGLPELSARGERGLEVVGEAVVGMLAGGPEVGHGRTVVR
jgi:hypothetical protein